MNADATDCEGCPDHGRCGVEPHPDGLEGGTLVAASIVVYGLPLGLALAGALSGETPGWQLAGGIAGLGLGMITAGLASRFFLNEKSGSGA